ncbi:hypothetical protein KC325_g98 [Hortaea werneckii]|nr:hypothetical protein KC325_g98 [Hortaea werneckii]
MYDPVPSIPLEPKSAFRNLVSFSNRLVRHASPSRLHPRERLLGVQSSHFQKQIRMLPVPGTLRKHALMSERAPFRDEGTPGLVACRNEPKAVTMLVNRFAAGSWRKDAWI